MKDFKIIIERGYPKNILVQMVSGESICELDGYEVSLSVDSQKFTTAVICGDCAVFTVTPEMYRAICSGSHPAEIVYTGQTGTVIHNGVFVIKNGGCRYEKL